MRFQRVFALACCAVVAAGGVWWALNRRAPERMHVVLADSPQILSALIYVARAEGFFDREGLDVAFQAHPTGRDAVAAVTGGKADMAVTAETPLAQALLAGHPVKVFATIQTTDREMSIIAPRAAGFAKASDLAGKRIGMVVGTSSEFFLDQFLVDQGLRQSGITVVPLPSPEAVNALAAGSIDALSAWTVPRLRAKKELPGGIVSFPMDGGYVTTWNLIAMGKFATIRQDALRRTLRALIAAERVVAADRPRAIAIVAQALGIEPAQMEELWDLYGFTVRLDQALLVQLEGLVRWNLQRNPDMKPPDVLDALHVDALASVDRARMTVLH